MRLFHLRLPVSVVGDMTMPPLGAKDVFLTSSGPGETTVLTLMQVANKAGASNLLLTAEPDGSAASLQTTSC